MLEARPSPFSPGDIGALRVRNRFLRAALYEGMCTHGVPSSCLIELHETLAASGVGMTTVGFSAVCEEGRSHAGQLNLSHPQSEPILKALVQRVHSHGAKASIQLSHAGALATTAGSRPWAPSTRLDLWSQSRPRRMTEPMLSYTLRAFEDCARRARDLGFDAVELQAAQGYLLSQFLSPLSNRRRDRWGGDLEGRMRFPLAVVSRIKRVLTKQPLLIKMNIKDGLPRGLTPEDAIQIARAFEDAGADALILSAGFGGSNAHFTLRGKRPPRIPSQRWPGRVKQLVRRGILERHYPFSEAFLFDDALKIAHAVSIPTVLGGGLRSFEKIEEALQAGFEFVALARPLLREPALIERWENGDRSRARCAACNHCVASVEEGRLQCAKATQPTKTSDT